MQDKTIWIINQYASTPETGMGGRHYHMARELAKQGHNVYLVAASYNHLLRKPPKCVNPYEVQAIEGFSLVWVKMPCYPDAHSKKRILNWLLFAWKLRGLSKVIADKPNAILCSSPSPVSFLGAKYLSKHYDARLVFEVRDIWPLTLIDLGGFSKNHPFILFLQWIEDKAYRESDRVISNLKNSVEHMVKRGMDENKFAWVPNGFSSDELQKAQDLPEVVLDQLPKDKFVIGYTGTLGVANALDTLIDAAEKLKEQTEIAFVLVGSGREKDRIKALANNKGLVNIFFLEPIPKAQVQSMLSQFEVCFVGLTKDPLFKFGVSPNKLFDYFVSGKPVIYAIESGEYTPVADARAGLQIPAEDSETLAAAVLKLYHTPQAERELMGDCGRRYARENHTYDGLANDLAVVMLGEQ